MFCQAGDKKLSENFLSESEEWSSNRDQDAVRPHAGLEAPVVAALLAPPPGLDGDDATAVVLANELHNS
jgi:hypothetical protein